MSTTTIALWCASFALTTVGVIFTIMRWHQSRKKQSSEAIRSDIDKVKKDVDEIKDDKANDQK